MAWLSGYAHRKAIPLTGGADGALTDFQLKLAIAYDSDMLSDFSDLRFTTEDGETLIDAWLEDKTDGTSADVWVEFLSTPANGVKETKGYLYYGKADAVSDWDGGATFGFFDDSGGDYGEGVVITSWGFNAIGHVLEVKVETITADGFNNAFTDALNDSAGANIYVNHAGSGNTEYYDGTMHTISSYTDPEIVVMRLKTTSNLDYLVYNNNRSLLGSVIDANYRDVPTQIDTMWTGAGGNDWQTRFHWAFIRKYAANPPTYGFGGEENAPTGLTILDFERAGMRGVMRGIMRGVI